MPSLLYHFSFQQPGRQYIDICFEIRDNTLDKLPVQLPAWRPGRYELAHFAKNIRSFRVEDGEGNTLPFRKQSKDCWQIETGGVSDIKVFYDYYAAELNAGSSYLDEEQLYVNPVNCCLYIPGRIDEPCAVRLDVPATYMVACDLPRGEKETELLASSFDRLADAPFIASSHLQHHSFSEREHLFHLWFMGKVNPDWSRLEKDFQAFCREQIDTMGLLPGPEYHFIFQVLPTPFYHGVEHTYSTVCALGPGYQLFAPALYNELLGVSSHELLHAWNVKTIRPSDLYPYDFTKENYSRLGWVYEGITTYYGDQFLLRSGVYTTETFLGTLNQKLSRHFTGYGRFNQAVAEASFDTWLDGYVAGIPHRKTSIYTEGNFCALMLDLLIREHSLYKHSLDDLMRILYADAQAGKPYTKERLLEILNDLADYDFAAFYATYIEGTSDYEPLLRHCLDTVGLQLTDALFLQPAEHRFGMTLSEAGGSFSVNLIAPGSPSEKAGIMSGDRLVAWNGTRVRPDKSQFSGDEQEISLHLFRKEQLKEFTLKATDEWYFKSRQVLMAVRPGVAQRRNWKSWTKQEFPR